MDVIFHRRDYRSLESLTVGSPDELSLLIAPPQMFTIISSGDECQSNTVWILYVKYCVRITAITQNRGHEIFQHYVLYV